MGELGRWLNAVYYAVSESPPETWIPPRLPCLYPSQHPSAVCADRAWSAYRPTPFRAGPQIVPARAVSHRIIAATRALRGPYCTKAHNQCNQNHEYSQEATPTLCQAIDLVVFHQDAPAFSPSVLPRWEEWPALPVLTETASPTKPHRRPSGAAK